MERPYHGLPWRDKRRKPRAPLPVDQSDLVTADLEDAPEPYERAYPDGSAANECWAGEPRDDDARAE